MFPCVFGDSTAAFAIGPGKRLSDRHGQGRGSAAHRGADLVQYSIHAVNSGMCPGQLADRLTVCCNSRAGTCDSQYCVVSYCLDREPKVWIQSVETVFR